MPARAAHCITAHPALPLVEVALDSVPSGVTMPEIDKSLLTSRRGIKGFFYNIRDKVMEKINEPYDTTRDDRYWWRALKHGKVDFNDSTFRYPRLVRFAYNVYQWETRLFNNYDTTYVRGVSEYVRFMIKNDNWLDMYHCRPEPGKSITFNSGAASSVGFYVSLMSISLGYSFDVDRIFGSRKTSSKMEISFATSRFTCDYYRMTNTGTMTLHAHDDETGIDHTIRHFHGMKRKSWGLRTYYLFNNRRYAHQAAYSCSKYQLRSAGSWLAGLKVMHQSFVFDASLATDEEKQMFETEESETLFNYTDYCLSGGYGFNCAMGKNWVYNCTLTLDAGVKSAHAVATSDPPGHYFVLNGKLRTAFTYSHRRYFATIQAYVDSHFFNTGVYRFGLHLFDLSTTLGIRF